MVRRITHIAFLLAVTVVIARLTTPDVLRDPWEASPGSGPTPAGAGPATGLVFDLLACLPALLVLLRRCIDRDFRLVMRWSHLPLFCLCGWALISIAWSADRFAAAVTASHFFAACCLLWAMSQLVRSAGRLRMVSALSLGLLLVLVTQSLIFRFVDVPENIAYWNQNKAQILKSHNWEPDSFSAKQFAQKLTSGELVGFFNSPNTFAAVGVLLFFACLGIGLQKIKDKEPTQWLLLPIVAAISLVWILVNAKSKTSAATPFVGVWILGMLAVFPQQLRRHCRSIFFSAIALITFTMIAIIGHGLYRHGLFPGHFSNSLDFRWKYWVASSRIWIEHPWIGVGWSNFGPYYLAHRLPEAAEEIKDPHNFLVRFFVELGVVGGILCIAWLVRLAWELTVTSSESKKQSDEDSLLSVRSIVIASAVGILLSVFANTDFSLGLIDTLSLLMRPLLYALALVLGTIAAAMLSPGEWELDCRPAPWVFYCIVTAIGLFLLHNLIDFSWFEAGVMFAFMALIGSAQGMTIAKTDRPAPRGIAIGATAVALLAWIAAAGGFVVPIVLAEQSADDANELIRTAPTDRSPESTAHFRNAADALANASSLVPYNADYIFREAQAVLNIGQLERGRALLAAARQVNPLMIDAYLLDANLQLATPHPDVAAIRADFQRIVELNPNDVSLHRQFGQALDRFGLHSEARQQYRKALEANAALPVGEPKRLSEGQVAELERKSAGR